MRACENAWGVPLISETGNFPTREDNFGDFRTKNDNKKTVNFEATFVSGCCIQRLMNWTAVNSCPPHHRRSL